MVFLDLKCTYERSGRVIYRRAHTHLTEEPEESV